MREFRAWLDEEGYRLEMDTTPIIQHPEEQFAPAWSEAQDKTFDLTAEYADAMTEARDAWLSLTTEQRMDPGIIDRYTKLKQALANGYRERRKETMAALTPPEKPGHMDRPLGL